MKRNLEIMNQIQREKVKESKIHEQPKLDDEINELAEKKRFTFDVIDIPNDPLR